MFACAFDLKSISSFPTFPDVFPKKVKVKVIKLDNTLYSGYYSMRKTKIKLYKTLRYCLQTMVVVMYPQVLLFPLAVRCHCHCNSNNPDVMHKKRSYCGAIAPIHTNIYDAHCIFRRYCCIFIFDLFFFIYTHNDCITSSPIYHLIIIYAAKRRIKHIFHNFFGISGQKFIIIVIINYDFVNIDI